MSKLLKMLNWVTLRQAAEYLSLIVGEKVSSATVLQLALDGQITLSVNLVNKAIVRRGRIVPLSEARTVPGLPIPGRDAYDVIMGIILPDQKRVLELDNKITTASGVWDLPLIGAESLDIEHEFHRKTKGPSVTLNSLDGAFIMRGDDVCQIQAHHSDTEFFDKVKLKKPWNHPQNFYPAEGLPTDAVIVVRTAELTRFQAALSEIDNMQRQAVTPPSSRSKTTYLNIIGALIDLMLGKTPAGKPQSVFSSQSAIIDALISHNPNTPGISKTTLENKFAEAQRRPNSK